MTRQPFESCPRFEGCSCNLCPLDPLAALHGGPRVALDGEQGCRASRAVREGVAVAHGHPAAWAWLPRELRKDRARARWLALSPEERERRLSKLGLQAGRHALGNAPRAKGEVTFPSGSSACPPRGAGDTGGVPR